MTVPKIPFLCSICIHNLGFKPRLLKICCRAFPNGIPDAILTEKIKHIDSIDNDSGLVFQPKSSITTFMKLNRKCKAGTYDDSNKCGPEKENKDDSNEFDTKSNDPVKTRETIAGLSHIEMWTGIPPILKSNEPKLSQEETNLLYKYFNKEKYSHAINKASYNPNSSTKSVIEKGNKIESIINRSILPINIVSFSGASDEEVNELLTKNTISSFISTSLDKNVTYMFGKNKIEFRLPKGTNALIPGFGLNHFSEHEVLLNRNTKFDIISDTIIDNPIKHHYIIVTPNKSLQSFQEVSTLFNPELGGFHTTDYKTTNDKSLRIISQDKADNPKLLEAIKDLDASKLPSQFMVMKMKAGTPAKYYTKTDSIGVDKNLSSSEMTTEIKKVLESMKQNSNYLSNVAEFMKLNYKCPKGSHDEGFGCGGEKVVDNEYTRIKKKSIDVGSQKMIFKEYPKIKVDNDFTESEIKMLSKQLKIIPDDIKSIINTNGHDLSFHKITDINEGYAGNYLPGHIQVVPNFSWVMHHEIGHLVDNELWNLSDESSYRNAMQADGKYITPVSKFGPTDYYHTPSEDFAEAISLYINNLNKFKKDFPNRYELITTRIRRENERNAQKQNSSYLDDVTNFMKLNKKCKVGTYDNTNACGPNEKNNNGNINLSQEEKQIVDYYQRSGYGKMNALLRNKNTTAVLPQERSIVEGQIKQLETAIDKSKLTKDITVFKGIGSQYGIYKNINNLVGTVVNDPGFGSTSTSVDIAAQHARVGKLGFASQGMELPKRGIIAVMKLPKGTPALDVGKDVPELAARDVEKEILLQHNTSFKVTSVDKSGPYWRVDMEAISDAINLGESSNDINTILSNYQDYGYNTINSYLRGINSNKFTEDKINQVKKEILEIDNEMSKNTLKNSITVYRADGAAISSDIFKRIGIGDPESFRLVLGSNKFNLENINEEKYKGNDIEKRLKHLLVGEEYTEPAFMSTGKLKTNTGKRFISGSSNIGPYGVQGFVELSVPKGTNAIRVSKYTGQENELDGKIDEYLLDRGQTIVIDDVAIKPIDDKRLYLEYKAHIKQNKDFKQNSSYLNEVATFMKLNYRCKKGTIDDSFKCDPEQEPSNINQTFVGFDASYEFPKELVATSKGRSDVIRVTRPDIQQKLDGFSKNLDDIATSSEKITLEKYSNTGYYNINDYLTGKLEESINKEEISIAKRDVENLDKLFTSAKLPDNLVTFRGLNDSIIVENPELREALDTPGSELTFKCFTSSSVLPYVAEDFATGYSGRMLEIQLPKGSKAIYIAGVSRSPSEFEMLINRDTRYEVVRTRNVKVSSPFKENNTRVIKVTTLKAIL